MEQAVILLIPFVVLFFFVLLAEVRRRRLASGDNTRPGKIFRRIAVLAVVFLCGAADLWLMSALYSSRFRPITTNIVLLGGLKWVVLFGIVWLFRSRLRLRNLPIFIVIVLFLMLPISRGLFLLLSWMQGIPISPWVRHFYSQPINWVPNFQHFPNNVYQFISPIALVCVTYVITRSASATSGRAPKVKYAQEIWSTSKGGSMHPSKSQTTRLLCASAFLVPGFRDQILKRLKAEGMAVSPELGMDLGLIATVCQYAKDREDKFRALLFIVALLALLGVAVDPLIGISILFLGGTITLFCKLYLERAKLVTDFSRNKFPTTDIKTKYAATLNPEAVSALPREDQNVFVYNEFAPFIGAGTDLGGWSFTVDLSKPADTLTRGSRPQNFQMAEMYDALATVIKGAGLEGVEIKDAYFVHGSDIRDDREILPDVYARPVQRLDGERARRLMTNSDPSVRHYKWITVHDWGQELVTSYFVRCSRRGSNMFVEINRRLLTPIEGRYRSVDALSPIRARVVLGYLIIAAVGGPLYAAISPLLMLGRLQEALENVFDKKEKQRRHAVEENPLYNFGSSESIREKFSSGHFMHYFQKSDGDFYIKMLERTLLSSIIDFLDEHQIDTSDLRERQTMILNSGIIVHGGDVNAESLAVGAGARAIKAASAPSKSTGKGAAA